VNVKQSGISHIHYPTIACIIQCEDVNIEQELLELYRKHLK